MKINQFLTGFSCGDAIGNYTLVIKKILEELGYESDIYAEIIHPTLKKEAFYYNQYPFEEWGKNLAIFHLSIGSILTEFLLNTGDNIILIYHNMTPPKYFFGVNNELVNRAIHGQLEVLALHNRCLIALGDSEFNRRDLERAGFKNTKVLPIPVDFERLNKKTHSLPFRMFDDKKKNILFTGRISPNKRNDKLITIFKAYNKYFNEQSRLIMVGAHLSYRPYLYQLLEMVDKHNLADSVVFTDHVSESELLAYYNMADLFLCASEHEGFCVPLLECFHLGIPVLAFDEAAVGETMGGSGILIEKDDPLLIAALIDEVLKNPSLRNEIIENQKKKLEKFKSFDFRKAFSGIIASAGEMSEKL